MRGKSPDLRREGLEQFVTYRINWKTDMYIEVKQTRNIFNYTTAIFCYLNLSDLSHKINVLFADYKYQQLR